MFIQCFQYFRFSVAGVTASDILTSLPCELNHISCHAINVENKVKKNLYHIEWERPRTANSIDQIGHSTTGCTPK